MSGAAVFLLLGLFVFLIFLWVNYNVFVALRQHIREAWSNIDTELKRRYDLIPNLVSVVRGYAEHERSVLESLTRLRTECMANHGTPAQQAVTENQLANSLGALIATVENYPDLKADAAFLRLQRELVTTEDRIQAARRFYNGNIREYQTRRESFPTNVIAGWFNFGPEDFLQLDPAIRGAAPRVAL